MPFTTQPAPTTPFNTQTPRYFPFNAQASAQSSGGAVSSHANVQLPAMSVRFGRVLKGQHKFQCNQCHNWFTKSSDLKRHVENSCGPNKGLKNFKCDFVSQDNIPYTKGYATKQALLDHKARDHNIGVGRYVCKYCQHIFNTSNDASAQRKLCKIWFGDNEEPDPFMRIT